MTLRIIYQDTTYTVVDGEACSTSAICAVEVETLDDEGRREYEDRLFRAGLRLDATSPTIAPGAILKVEGVPGE